MGQIQKDSMAMVKTACWVNPEERIYGSIGLLFFRMFFRTPRQKPRHVVVVMDLKTFFKENRAFHRFLGGVDCRTCSMPRSKPAATSRNICHHGFPTAIRAGRREEIRLSRQGMTMKSSTYEQSDIVITRRQVLSL
jgi:hypothetical protein